MERDVMEAMRFEYLEHLIPLYGEKECVRLAFASAIKTRMDLAEMGIEVDVPKFIILNGKYYTQEFFNDN